MLTARCRYGDLLVTAALLACLDPEYVRCAEPAVYNAIAATDDDGYRVEITVPVCPVHEAHVSHNVGYVRSIKLRSRPDSATTSPAADS